MTAAIVAAGDATGDTMEAFGFGQVGLSMVMTFGLNFLWGMINALQMAVHLPVFSIQFPGLASVLYSSLFEVATFEFIDIKDEVNDIF